MLALTAACGAPPTFSTAGKREYAPAPPAPLACTPNLDGHIDSNEMQAALGVPVSYLVTPAGTNVPVDLEGGVDSKGDRVFDWSKDDPSDQVAKLQAAALSGRWYAASFPGAQFVAPLDAGATLEAAYSQDADGIWLYGYASAKQDPPEGRTLVVYSAKVALYRFPIQVGATWVSVGEVNNALIRGLPYAGRDTYQVKVDAEGELDLPDIVFTQVLRSRTQLTIQPAVGAPISRRQVSFLFECFGEVARATSRDDEPAEDFTTAAEVRRLGL